MRLVIGLAFVLLAGVFQGSFILPMTLTRKWEWEHSWAVFSLLGMLVFNWAIGAAVLPGLPAAIRMTDPAGIYALLLFGACWGVGAILFGLGMKRLGMAVGYPVIMGLILSVGALIPLVQSGAGQLTTAPGVLLLAGTLIVLSGIILCSRAAGSNTSNDTERPPFVAGAGLTIALFAGIFSSLPNIGLNNAARLTESATRLGAAPELAGNAAWVVQFTAGFVVNFVYCAILMVRRRNAAFILHHAPRNLSLVAGMALMWILSFYLYGLGATLMGRWGPIIGWPVFISLAILVGNLWGLWRGEWKSASPSARARLSRGLLVILGALVLFGLGSALR